MASLDITTDTPSTETNALGVEMHAADYGFHSLSTPNLPIKAFGVSKSICTYAPIEDANATKVLFGGNLFKSSGPDHCQVGEPIVNYDNIDIESIASSDAHIDDMINVQNSKASNNDEEWKNLLDDKVTDCTQANIAEVPHLQALYAKYSDSCTDFGSTNPARMEMAKALAFALLTVYFPTSQDCVVAPSSPGPMAKNGMSFILKGDNGTDPTYKTQVKKAGPVSWKLVNSTKWHWVEPENITSFVVMSKVTTKKRRATMSHTYIVPTRTLPL